MRCWWWTAEANASTIDRADESFWLRLISDHGRLQGQERRMPCAWRTAVAPRTSGRAIEACATGPPRARSHDVVLMARTDLVARRSTLPTEAWASSGQPRAGMQLGHRRRRHHHRRRRHHLHPHLANSSRAPRIQSLWPTLRRLRWRAAATNLGNVSLDSRHPVAMHAQPSCYRCKVLVTTFLGQSECKRP